MAISLDAGNLAGAQRARNRPVCPCQYQSEPLSARFHHKGCEPVGAENTLTGPEARHIFLEPPGWQGQIVKTDIRPSADKPVQHNQRADRQGGNAKHCEYGKRTVTHTLEYGGL